MPCPSRPTRSCILRSLAPLLLAPLVLAGALTAPATAAPAERPLPPTVTGVSADSGPVDGGQFVTLRGSGLTRVTQVSFGATRTARLHAWSDSELTVRVPAHGAGRVLVRAAAPGIASAYDEQAAYTFTADAPTLTWDGPAAPAPAVAEYDTPSDTRAPQVAMTCPTADFCAVSGDLGVATFDGRTWSAVTRTDAAPTGARTDAPSDAAAAVAAEPLISCADPSSCLAVAPDSHVWHLADGTWTDLGAQEGITSLSCGGPQLCGAVVNDKAVLFDGRWWSTAATLFEGGVSGLSCTNTRTCVANSVSHFWRTWQGEWSPARPMYSTQELRDHDLTRNVTGALECTSAVSCVSGGYVTASANSFVAFLTDGVWSLKQLARSEATDGDVGRTASLECRSSTFCLKDDVLRDGAGRATHAFSVVSGNEVVPAGLEAPAPLALSCWGPATCVSVRQDGTWARTRG